MTYQTAFRSSDPRHRRLAYCTTASAVTILGFIALFDWPAGQRVSDTAVVIHLTLPGHKPEAEPVADQPTEEEEEPPVVLNAAEVSEAPRPAGLLDDARAAAAPSDQPEVDWQASLERASAEIIRRHSVVQSLHPEFDELRRNAEERYSEPRTGKPPPIWENVERDIYGRTLLQLGNGCYRVLDDTNVGNRYAFETFERHVVLCNLLAKAPRQEFPWVETIVERYAYLREPDGGWLQEAARP
ncbi:MAG TPA: hypothetical protein VFZ51_08615 [Woeseiaceae bacterium]